jgi:hypothetical protein
MTCVIAADCRANNLKPNGAPLVENLKQQLTLLDDLREQGVISESEFQAQKEKLLKND